MSTLESLEIVFNSEAPYAQRVRAINEVRNEPLFISRYNQLKALEGKNISEISPDDARLVRIYIRNQDPKYATTLFSHYIVSADNGIVKVRMRESEELVEELVSKYKTWETFQTIQMKLVEAIAKLL